MAVKKSSIVNDIAEERIQILYDLAKESYEREPALSRRYIRLIRQMSRHYKVRLSKEIKRGICKRCDSVLIPGRTAKVRLASSKGYLIYKCLNCGAQMHVHY